MSVSIMDKEIPTLILALESLIDEAEQFVREPYYLDTARTLHRRLGVALMQSDSHDSEV